VRETGRGRRPRARRRAYLRGGAGRLVAAVRVAAAISEARALRSRGGGRRARSAREARARGPRDRRRVRRRSARISEPQPLAAARAARGRAARGPGSDARRPSLDLDRDAPSGSLCTPPGEAPWARSPSTSRRPLLGWSRGQRLATLFQPSRAARGVGRVGAPAGPHARFDRSDPVLGCSARPAGRDSRRAPRITRARTQVPRPNPV